MWLLLFFSGGAAAICLERLLYFFASYTPFPDMDSLLATKRRTSRKSSAGPLWEELFRSTGKSWLASLPFKQARLHNSAYYRLACIYREHWNSPEKSRRAALERSASECIGQMERRISALQVIALVTPLIGLLGTILGMMQSFQVIEASAGQADISQLAGGIWVAMLTTAFGLSISIPTHLMYNIFHKLLDARVQRMNALVQYLEERRHAN